MAQQKQQQPRKSAKKTIGQTSGRIGGFPPIPMAHDVAREDGVFTAYSHVEAYTKYPFRLISASSKANTHLGEFKNVGDVKRRKQGVIRALAVHKALKVKPVT